MCTLLLWNHFHPRYSLIAAANRDELLDRPATGPTQLCDDPLVIGGRDLTAGGTWLAVNAAGMVVALTNRQGAGSHDPARRSRGVLVLEVAASPSLAHAQERMSRVDAALYNPFIMIAADAQTCTVAAGGSDGLHVQPLADGAHAITNWDLDSNITPKSTRALKLAREFSIAQPGNSDFELAERIHALLADHALGCDGDSALCVHRPQANYGTRSSSIVFLGPSASQTRLYHAEGPACSSQLRDFSHMLGHESAARASNTIGG
jgi:uncharacterized protein with NRDE domain